MAGQYLYLTIPYIAALFLAINMGGSGTGPSFSAAFGANVIKKSYIPGIFGVMVFLGAIIAGKHTSETIGKGLINPDLMSFQVVSIILFSVGISLLVANLSGIPQSTAQSTVLAIFAAGVYFGEYNSHKIFFEVIPTWFILPVIAFILSLLIGKYIYRPMRRRGLTMSRAMNMNQKKLVNGLILFTAMYVSFSIGSNNVANASGPIATMTANELNVTSAANKFLITILSVLMIAPAFGIGSSVFGTRILNNTGKEIVLFGKFEAGIIAIVSASLLLYAAVARGIPTSLVQLNVACIIGVGVAKLGVKNIFRKTEVRKFFLMWLIAPAIAFTLCLFLLFFTDKLGYF